MIFPDFLKQNDTIGVTAVSDGVGNELDQKRFYNGREQLKKRGYEVIFTDNVFRVGDKGRSADAATRGREFNSLLQDKRVKAIVAAKGGNFLNEMMAYVDYEAIVKQPKWYQGYSDNTWLTYVLTTKYDIATLYGSNFGDFGMQDWQPCVENNLAVLEGKEPLQHSFERYQNGFDDRVTGLEGYKEDTAVCWKTDGRTAGKESKTVISGRWIGGCLDTLMILQGTGYDTTPAFVEKYKEDGIVWYLESFETTAENLMMNLWKLKESGWFKHAKGFVFGRPLFYRASMDTSYEEGVMYALGEYDVPVIFDADIGHLGPRMTIMNGARGIVETENRKGTIRFVYGR